MALEARVERISTSDLSRSQQYTGIKGFNKADHVMTRQATHVIRLLGVVGTADEMEALATILRTGGVAAQRLLVQRLVDIQTALLALTNVVNITFGGDNSTPSHYDGGSEVNTLATYLSGLTGQSKNQSFYASSTGTFTDTQV